MRSTGTIAMAALAGALAFVPVLQVRDPGFERGHRGWVSAHTLAIAQKATPDNGFVGHAVSLLSDDNRDLYYFDRYPVFFSAALHALLVANAPDKAAGIVAARQAMNAVYALTVVASAVLLAELGLAVEVAIAAAALVFAATTLVEFRDMVHFDQPALLGMVVLLAAIARHIRRGNAGRLVIVATVFAVGAGRGYASLPLLALWWVLDAAGTLRRTRGSDIAQGPENGSSTTQPVARERGVLVHIAFRGLPARACWTGGAVAAACLAWNIHTEARLRHVPWSQTSIVGSAGRRLAFDADFNADKGNRLGFGAVAGMQQQNLLRAVVPWSHEFPLKEKPAAKAALALLVLAVAGAFVASRDRDQRAAWTLVLLAGPLWLAPMRNLAAFHPYTGLFLAPTALVFFAALLHRLGPRAGAAAAVAACALLVQCTASRNAGLSRLKAAAMRDTADMQAVAAALQPGEPVAVDGRVFRGVPFALGYYLPDHDVQVGGRTNLMLTRGRGNAGENLTPDNFSLFLVRLPQAREARSRLSRHLPGLHETERRHGARPAGRGRGESGRHR